MVPVVRKLARLENAHDKQLITFFAEKKLTFILSNIMTNHKRKVTFDGVF